MDNTYHNLREYLEKGTENDILHSKDFLRDLKNIDSYTTNLIFNSKPNIKKLNVLIRQAFVDKKEGIIFDLSPLYEFANSQVTNFNNSKSLHNDGYKIHDANLTTILIYEAFRKGEPDQILPLIENGDFSEYSLLNVSSDILSNKTIRKTGVLESIKEKTKMYSQDPEIFLLYSYLAEGYKTKKPNQDEFEDILHTINPHIRLEDFSNFKEELKLKTFGYGLKTQQISEMLIEKAAFNAVSDFRDELEIELTPTVNTSRKMKI